MRLIKFRIKNYKSIKDSGYCYLENGITILAGKNESGKTAILEALEDFDIKRKIREKAIPLQSPKAIPEVAVTFELDKELLTSIFTMVGSKVGISQKNNIEIVKKFPDSYSLSEPSLNSLKISKENITEESKKTISDIYEKVKEVLLEFPSVGGTLPDLNFSDIRNFQEQLHKLKEQITPNLQLLTDENKKLILTQNLDELIKKIDEIASAVSIEQRFIEVLKKHIPNFILFSSFDDIFQSEISLKDAANNELIKDLDIISDLNLNLITSGSITDKTKHKEQLNIRIKSDYKNYWTQDLTNLHVDWDSEKLYFFVKEDEDFYPPEIRSKGKQWHLAFYVRVSARSKEKVPNIILIDEPGLFLHATAQRDVLKKLEDSSKTIPIIFSTHSPYLLEPDKFNCIRLIQRGSIPKHIEAGEIENIEKNFGEFYEEKTHTDGSKYYKLKFNEFSEEQENKLKGVLFKMGYNIGTVIESKIHKVADKETLTPILTAIGLELTSGITNLDKINNVVVEGQSDWYYLQAFKRLLQSSDINFIFGGGAGNMPFVGTILSGWGCRVLYLYDNDKGKKDAEKNIKSNWLISVKELLTVTKVKDGCIEDLFDHRDFKKFVLKDESVTYKGLNSQYLRNLNKDKVLLAKLFLESSRKNNISLSKKNLDFVKELFKIIEEKFIEVF